MSALIEIKNVQGMVLNDVKYRVYGGLFFGKRNKARYIEWDVRTVGINSLGFWDPASVDFALEQEKAERARNSKAVIARRAFVCTLTKDGKRNFAENVYWKLIRHVRSLSKVKRHDYFLLELLEGISPVMRLKDKKAGAQVYKLPIPLHPPKDLLFGSRWLLERRRDGVPLLKFLEKLCVDLENTTSGLYQRKEEVYKIAKENRAFVRYLNI